MKSKVQPNDKFGRLTVIDLFYQESARGRRIRANCLCQCGNKTDTLTANLMNGTSKSCGCLSLESKTTHGLTANRKKPDLYNIWDGMLRRSSGKKQAQRSKTYMKISHEYGIYEPWRSFEQFCKDMGPRPSKNHSLDRIDNEKGYYPGNCRWATHKEQVANRSHYKKYLVFGEYLTQVEICKKYNIAKSTVNQWCWKKLDLDYKIKNYKTKK